MRQLTTLGVAIGLLLMTAGVYSTWEYATNSSDKATASYTRTEVANAMKQFRRDLDAQLQTAGNAVMGTINALPGGNVFTLDDTPFGARLFREKQKIQVYSANLATNRGAATITAVAKSLGAAGTQKITCDGTPGGTIATDVLVPEGLSGASPVGLYGLPYHHNSSATGTWLGISRANNYVVAELVNANSAGLALPHLRLAVDKMMQIIGIDEMEALKQLVWYGHRAQKAAYHEIAFAISQLAKGGGGQDFDLLFKGEQIGGIKTMWNIHADPTRLDLINFETWGRVEWKEIDYYEVNGDTVFPVYGASGGIAAAYLFYFVTGIQYFVDNPKAVGGITSLAVPTGYVS